MLSAKAKFHYEDGYGNQHSQSPISTGTSVLGLAFDKGVVVAADQLASYGSMARFFGLQRVARVNDKTVIGCGGDYADYQSMMQSIEQKVIEEASYEDGYQINPRAMHSWLTRVQYNKRSNFDPLWCSWVIGGIDDDGKPYLGYTDKLGMAFADPIIATGFGAYLAAPLLRAEYEARGGKFTEEEAVKAVQKCLEVLYYRDARSWPKYNLAIVTEKGSRIEGPLCVSSNWEVAHSVTGYK